MIGQVFAGKYTIARLVGKGAMGSVYEARHSGTGRRVAVKVIAAEFAADARLVQRFEAEARATGAIESQHIAQVLDVGVDQANGTPFMVMEFLSGEDLEHLCARLGPLAPQLAMRVVAQAAVGLEKAHAAGIVHRDVKPANMFLTERDDGDHVVKLVDFGIAKMNESDKRPGATTRAGTLIGSPLYMSPEQTRGAPNVDRRADVWSLGVVLYELLAGAVPWDDQAPLGELIISICSTPAPSVRAAAPWVEPALAAVVEKALRIPVGDRYQTAGELLQALRPLLPHGTTIHASMLVPLASARDEGRAPPPAPDARTSAARFASTTGEPDRSSAGLGSTLILAEGPPRPPVLTALPEVAARAMGQQSRASTPPWSPTPWGQGVPVAPPGAPPARAVQPSTATSIASVTSSRITVSPAPRRSWGVAVAAAVLMAAVAATALFVLRSSRVAESPAGRDASLRPESPPAVAQPTAEAPAGSTPGASPPSPEPVSPSSLSSPGPSAAPASSAGTPKPPMPTAAPAGKVSRITTAPRAGASAAPVVKPTAGGGAADPFGGIRQ